MRTELNRQAGPVAAAGPARLLRVAIFAPHLVTPIRNGGDVYIWRKWGALDRSRYQAWLFAGDGVYELGPQGWGRPQGTGVCSLRSKPRAAARALLTGSDYLSARFETPAYLERVRGQLHEPPDLAVYSFVSTWRHVAPVVGRAGRSLVETHNFEPKFYLDRAVEAGGVVGIAASVAAARCQRLLAQLPRELPLVALGEADAQMFRALGFREVLLSALGYEAEPPRSRFPDGPGLRIAFVGALSISMNVTAIRSFALGALPRLRQALDLPLEVHVAGSRPSAALVAQLQRQGVQVHSDLPDAELASLLDSCHATILPFESSNGLKLKFASSAARGVPILSYIPPPPELAGAAAVLVSRDMAEWAAFLRHVQEPARQAQAARELQGIVRGRTWRAGVEANLAALAAARA